MNYLNMVDFLVVNEEKVISRLCCQKRESYLRAFFDNVKIIPNFIILEAIFQTAGRLARNQNQNNSSGGIIASYRNFCFTRPLFAGEDIQIIANCVSSNEKSFYFKIFIVNDKQEKILENGTLIISKLKNLKGSVFNNFENKNIETLKEKFSFK